MEHFNQYVDKVLKYYQSVVEASDTARDADKFVGHFRGGIAAFRSHPRVLLPRGKAGKHVISRGVVSAALTLKAQQERRRAGARVGRVTRHNNTEGSFLRERGVAIATEASQELLSLRAVSNKHLENATAAVRNAKAYQAAANAFEDAMKEPVTV